MKLENSLQKSILTNKIDDIVKALSEGKIAVFPTDTLYGILANSLDKNAVEKVYKIKKRNPKKPYVILINDISSLDKFSAEINDIEEKLLKTEGVTVVLNLKNPEKFNYLHRGIKTLAFRMPQRGKIKELLEKVKKPLIAPSANPEGLSVAKNVEEAITYFKDEIDIYFNGGEIKNTFPSTIVRFENNSIKILREGKVKREEILNIIG